MQSGNHAHQRTRAGDDVRVNQVLRRFGKGRLLTWFFGSGNESLPKSRTWTLRLKWIFFISASLAVVSAHLWQSLDLPYY
jgi:hypothetical protein